MLTFEEKVMALTCIRNFGFKNAVELLAKHKRRPTPAMRDALYQIDTTHYLLEDGFIEKTDTGNILYVGILNANQPTVLTKEYFDKCSEAKQETIATALTVMNCMNLLRSIKPTLKIGSKAHKLNS